MRAIPLTVTVLAAALALTACDDGGSSGSSKPKAGSACAIGSVSVEVGSASVAPAAGDSGEVPVSITNQSAPCTLDHFPSVTLGQEGRTAKLAVQQGAQAQKLKLAKGDSAGFTVAYVRGKDGDAKALNATSMSITLPGGGASQSFPWKYGPVAGKGGRSDVDASVSAFQQAGD
ncbi:DUF4232 domain-containing protein [Streptomyces sp. NBC_00820]|uniref:DUF4232 domain-containing protein n=1 Tax=Streptomyces sp. NBC_00820 TaxID=2975842 RepID=UPI002ED04628|nr:DUF4232 domain-containing protein [Streptomyces sp. NBC_00820]